MPIVPFQELASRLDQDRLAKVHCRFDRLFGWLLPLQWLVAIVWALIVTPRTWIGESYAVHVHVWAALIIGGLLVLPPLVAIRRAPGAKPTRLAVAVAQGLFSALFIHLSGGRIETHFLIFATLPLLACYRDTAVLLTATALVGIDHAVRGVYWPQSVFGVMSPQEWRWIEHVAWVLLEVSLLQFTMHLSRAETRTAANKQAELSHAHEMLERTVDERTRELRDSLEHAESGMRARTTFLSNISHELHTPLNAVIAMTQSAGEQARNPDQEELILGAQDAARRLLGLVDDLLEWTRVESAPSELPVREFGLREQVADLAIDAAPLAERRGVRVFYDVSPEVPELLEGPLGPLSRLLHCLLEEAVSHYLQGEVCLQVQCEGDAVAESVPLAFTLRARRQVRDDATMPGEAGRLCLIRRSAGQLSHDLASSLSGRLGASLEQVAHDDQDWAVRLKVSLNLAEAPETPAPLCCKRVLVIGRDTTEGLALKHLVEFHGGEASLHCGRYPDRPEASGWDLVVLPEEELVEHAITDPRFVGTVWRRTGTEALRPDRLLLPAHPASVGRILAPRVAAERADEWAATAPYADSRCRILVVEDDAVNRRVALSLIERQGAEYEVAMDGLEAIEKLRVAHYDLVLMDLRMPNLDGLEATRRWRAEEVDRGLERTRIVALTANDSDEDRRACREVGMDGFLAKPVRPAMLTEVLHQRLTDS